MRSPTKGEKTMNKILSDEWYKICKDLFDNGVPEITFTFKPNGLWCIRPSLKPDKEGKDDER